MATKRSVKCFNKSIHQRGNGEGHLLCVVGKSELYLHCNDRACKRWTKIKISFPGIHLDFTKAAIVQELMPAGYHFDLLKAAVVIGGDDASDD